jgi:hypothetical protein
MSQRIDGLDRRKDGGSITWATWLLALTLLITPLVSAQKQKTQSDYFVKSLPGQPDAPLRKMHAG